MSAPVYQWQPSTAEIARRAGIDPADVIRFDHNTSPYRVDWAETEAAASAALLNEYPAADYTPLREAAGERAGVDADWVVPGAGADELIGLCARAFLEPGGTSIGVDPSYTLYRIAAAHAKATYSTVESPGPDFPYPGADLADRPEDIVWLCIPNNPTGVRPSDAAVEAIVGSAAGIVVLDAAYAEFADDRWASWVERFDNLVVLHTMSKAYGLAGIRVGYSISQPDLAARLHAVRPPGSVSTTSAALAMRALRDPRLPDEAVDALTAARAVLAKRLADLGVRVLPSQTNFLLCEVGDGAAAAGDRLMREGIVVRSYHSGPLNDYLRFTVRTADEHDRLIEALERNLP